MTLPERVRVKLSSEEAGGISFTPVVVQEMSLRELLELIVAQTGKNFSRVTRLLEGGTLISGASRLRWEPFETDEQAVRSLLSTLPDADAARRFQAEHCVRAVLYGAGGQSLDLPREVAAKRRLLRRRSFWEAMLDLVAEAEVQYIDYSYREKADRFRLELSGGQQAAIRQAARLLVYSGLEERLRCMELSAVELFVVRRE